MTAEIICTITETESETIFTPTAEVSGEDPVGATFEDWIEQFAQDLLRLLHKGYSKDQQGSREAEMMGRSVLAYQFVACLCQKIKTKIAGNEGNFEQLLTQARFPNSES